MGAQEHDCSTTADAAVAFLGGRLSAPEVSAIRAHRRGCEACDGAWRETVGAAASLQHNRRVQRVQDEKVRRRHEHRRMALAGMALQGSGGKSGLAPGKKRAYSRLLLLPAVAFILMLVIYPMGFGRGARLEVLAGEVDLTANTYGIDDDPVPLVRGDQASTEAAGRARIDCAKGVLQLGGSTYIVVEDADAGRFRLDQGELMVAGDCTLTTRYGVIEIEGAEVSVSARQGGVELESRSGSVRATNSEGEHQVPPGVRVVLGRPTQR